MFRFKQFTIQQDRTAMKVCTDACVLGAYADVTGVEAGQPANPVKRILDIGTGTGLLALMAAQRNPTATIDAVELDDAALRQAAENMAASPFADRVQAFAGRIQDFRAGLPAPALTYDRILTNPPFYTNHLRSPDTAVNRALHTDELPFAELIQAVVRLLNPQGQWWVLVPPYEAEQLAHLAKGVGLVPFKRLFLRHHPQKPIFRGITGFSFGQSPATDETLVIYERDGRTYTNDFWTLLRNFYLIF